MVRCERCAVTPWDTTLVFKPFSSSKKGKEKKRQVNVNKEPNSHQISFRNVTQASVDCCIPPSLNLQPSPSTGCQHTLNSKPPPPSLINCTFSSMPSIESFHSTKAASSSPCDEKVMKTYLNYIVKTKIAIYQLSA